MKNFIPTPEQWKQAILSILVGAAITFFTYFLQGILDFLKAIPTEAPGIIAALVRQSHIWSSNRIV